MKYGKKLTVTTGITSVAFASLLSIQSAQAAEQNHEIENMNEIQKKTYNHVSSLDGILEHRRSAYIDIIKQRSDDKTNQEVFVNSSREDIQNEAAVAQQNAYYSLLHNTELSTEQRNTLISELHANPSMSQEIFYKSLHPNMIGQQSQQESHTIEEELSTHPQVPIERPQNIYSSNDSMSSKLIQDQLPKRPLEDFKPEELDINDPSIPPLPEEDLQLEPPIVEAPKVEKPNTEIGRESNNQKDAPKDEEKPEISDQNSTDKDTGIQQPEIEVAPETDLSTEIEETPKNQDTEAEMPNVDTPADNSYVSTISATLNSWYESLKHEITSGYGYLKGYTEDAYEAVKSKLATLKSNYETAKTVWGLYNEHKDIIDVVVNKLLGTNKLQPITKVTVEYPTLDKSSNWSETVKYPFNYAYALGQDAWYKTKNKFNEYHNTYTTLSTLYNFYQENPRTVTAAINAANLAKSALSTLKVLTSPLTSWLWSK